MIQTLDHVSIVTENDIDEHIALAYDSLKVCQQRVQETDDLTAVAGLAYKWAQIESAWQKVSAKTEDPETYERIRKLCDNITDVLTLIFEPILRADKRAKTRPLPKDMKPPAMIAETVIVSESTPEGYLYVGSEEKLNAILEEEGESTNDSDKRYEYIYLMGVACIMDHHPMANDLCLKRVEVFRNDLFVAYFDEGGDGYIPED